MDPPNTTKGIIREPQSNADFRQRIHDYFDKHNYQTSNEKLDIVKQDFNRYRENHSWFAKSIEKELRVNNNSIAKLDEELAQRKMLESVHKLRENVPSQYAAAKAKSMQALKTITQVWSSTTKQKSPTKSELKPSTVNLTGTQRLQNKAAQLKHVTNTSHGATSGGWKTISTRENAPTVTDRNAVDQVTDNQNDENNHSKKLKTENTNNIESNKHSSTKSAIEILSYSTTKQLGTRIENENGY
jgi:hypothetical protein